MPTPAKPIWKPSSARTVVVDSFVPVPRGSTAVAPPPLNWPAKDPTDILDYQLDISPAVLGNEGDVIADLDVSISPSEAGDLMLKNAYADGTLAIMWFSAGQSGVVYTVTIQIATNNGRMLQRSVLLPVLPLSTVAIPINAIVTNGGLMITDQNGNPVITT